MMPPFVQTLLAIGAAGCAFAASQLAERIGRCDCYEIFCERCDRRMVFFFVAFMLCALCCAAPLLTAWLAGVLG
jgi:MFS family permease